MNIPISAYDCCWCFSLFTQDFYSVLAPPRSGLTMITDIPDLQELKTKRLTKCDFNAWVTS